MKKYYHSYLILIVGYLILFYVCSCSFNFLKYSSNKNIFIAKDSQYFPFFILEYFKGAQYFTDKYPTISQAQNGLQLIEVKPLYNQNNAYNEANLAWSYDGYYLSYEINTPDYKKILIKNLKGNFEKEIKIQKNYKDNFLIGMLNTQFITYNSKLSWSPTDYYFVFMSNVNQGEYNIYIGNTNSTAKELIQSPHKDGYANWSPMGNEITFVSARSGNGDIYLINIKTQYLQRLTFSNDPDLFPEWTPDGLSIIYNSGASYNHQIFIVSKNSINSKHWNKSQKLTCLDQDILRPTISKDGKYIAFYMKNILSNSVSTSESKWNIHVIPLDPNKCLNFDAVKSTVIAHDVVLDLNTGPTWGPNNNKIFYVKNDPQNFNPIYAYDIVYGKRYKLLTNTKLNHDIMISNLGVLSFRAQVGPWEKIFLALTNQGKQLQNIKKNTNRVIYEKNTN